MVSGKPTPSPEIVRQENQNPSGPKFRSFSAHPQSLIRAICPLCSEFLAAICLSVALLAFIFKFPKSAQTTTSVGFPSSLDSLIFNSPEFQPLLPRRSQVLVSLSVLSTRAAVFFSTFCLVLSKCFAFCLVLSKCSAFLLVYRHQLPPSLHSSPLPLQTLGSCAEDGGDPSSTVINANGFQNGSALPPRILGRSSSGYPE